MIRDLNEQELTEWYRELERLVQIRSLAVGQRVKNSHNSMARRMLAVDVRSGPEARLFGAPKLLAW